MTLGVILMNSCEKDYFFNNNGPNNPNNPNNLTTVKLFYSTGAKDPKGEITSNTTITINDTLHYSSWWLEPSSGDSIVKGIFTIRKNGIIMYQSAVPENGIDFIFSYSGIYDLEVSGNSFSFVNISIHVFSGSTPPVSSGTSPIRLSDLSMTEAEGSVKISAYIGQWGNISSTNFFHAKRINALNFITNQPVTKSNDSLFFTLNFPKVNSTFVEFNVGYQISASNTPWLMPNIGNPPSTLYNGIGLPYSDSQYFFGFRVVQTAAGWELRNNAGLLLLSYSNTPQIIIPGNNGDGFLNNYQVRWSGLTYYFKTTIASPTFQFKIGENGSPIYLPVTTCSENIEYKKVTFPAGTSGTIFFEWGSTSEMQHSKYWDASKQKLIKIL